MHKLNVLIFGPSSVFISTLNELKPFLKFKYFSEKKLTNSKINFDIFFPY